MVGTIFASLESFMEIVTLIFPTMEQLADFETIVGARDRIIDRHNLSITGPFSQKEIDLGLRRYNAEVYREEA